MVVTSPESARAQLHVDEGSLRFLAGTNDERFRRFERLFEVEIGARGGEVTVTGDPEGVAACERLIGGLAELQAQGFRLRGSDIRTAERVVLESADASVVDFFLGGGAIAGAKRLVAPRSLNQKRYLQAMLDHELVVSVGPAGTGKTYLAVAMAASALAEKRVRRLILARPAVEAGEKLGFLPGDLAEKVNPYLRPLYDALFDIIGYDKVSRMMEREVIEVAPLAFMRGRTLNDSFIILDEAQNTTPEQMKMFLTRIGLGSRAVINGDITQVDLPSATRSGLRDAQDVLRDVEGVSFVGFGERDVVRHDLVQRIVSAYSERDRQRAQERPDDEARRRGARDRGPDREPTREGA